MPPPKNSYPWNDESIARLREMWARGLLAADIAYVLTKEYEKPCAEKAVMGKAYRLGLGGKDRPASMRKGRPPKPAGAARIAKHTHKARKEPAPALMTLEEVQKVNGCRWPVGHRPNMKFCGQKKKPSSEYQPHPSYCEAHSLIATNHVAQPFIPKSTRVA